MDTSRPADAPPSEPAMLGLTELRAERARARRALELAQLRSRQAAGDAAGAVGREPAGVDALAARVRLLTDELISRYAADLSLVDSLLDPAYPHGVGTKPAPARGRGGR